MFGKEYCLILKLSMLGYILRVNILCSQLLCTKEMEHHELCCFWFVDNATNFCPSGFLSHAVAGDVMNIILDPILIFACRLGVTGAAIAHVLSQ